MSTPSKGRHHKSRLRLFLILGLAVVVVGVGGTYYLMGAESAGEQKIATLTLEPTDLTISLVEGGSLRAPQSFEVTSPIEGSTTVLYLAEEGSQVEEGDLLVELDVSSKADELTRQEIAVQNADAAFTEAKESLEIQENVNKSNEREAELTLEFARTDLRKFLGEALAARIDELVPGGVSESEATDAALGGEGMGPTLETTLVRALGATDEQLRSFLTSDLESSEPPANDADSTPPGPAAEPNGEEPMAQDEKTSSAPELDVELNYEGEWGQQRRAAQTEIEIAREEKTRAQTRLQFTEKLEAKGYVTSDDLIADQLALKRQKINLELAYSKQQVLLDYTGPSTLKQLIADVHKAADELTRVRAKSRAELAKAKANLEAKEAVRDLERTQYDELVEQINSAKIYAPHPGLVVYASNSRGRRGGDERPLEVGSDVRERQLILSIPDTSTMIADSKIHESALSKVRTGLGALVRIDASEGDPIPGRVTKVGVLPDSQSSWLNPDLKVYSTEVTLDGDTSSLRPGMSCSVEILVKRLEDVLAVPLYAVHRRGRVNYVLVQRPSGLEARVVELGMHNDKLIEIVSGLETGDVVLLGRPEGAPAPEGAGTEEGGESTDLTAFPEAIDELPGGQQRSRRGETDEERNGERRPGGFDPAEMRRRFENMSEEERQQLRERMQREGGSNGGRREGRGGRRGGRGGRGEGSSNGGGGRGADRSAERSDGGE